MKSIDWQTLFRGAPEVGKIQENQNQAARVVQQQAAAEFRQDSLQQRARVPGPGGTSTPREPSRKDGESPQRRDGSKRKKGSRRKEGSSPGHGFRRRPGMERPYPEGSDPGRDGGTGPVPADAIQQQMEHDNSPREDDPGAGKGKHLDVTG
ncbi:MAG: hypothetical protein HYY09_05315 [Firmicutes bacterium]|nr:hypothetical protein [Bacillota bacterium]